MPRIGITCSSAMGVTQPIETVGRLYIDGIVAAGGVPIVLPALHRSAAFEVMDGIDGLVLTGGGDVDPARYGEVPRPECGPPDRARDSWELELVEAARVDEIPVLGICRGAQVLNVALGGGLVQHLPDRDDGGHDDVSRAADEVHEVAIAPGTRLHRILGVDAVRVNTIHHQSIDPVRIAAGLRVTGLADDGVVEAIESGGADESPDRFVGVQWHPELMLDRAPHQRLFDWVVRPGRVEQG